MPQDDKVLHLMEKMYMNFNKRFDTLETAVLENKVAIQKVDAKIESDISEKIRGLYDSREVIHEKLDHITFNLEDVKEAVSNVELITASNWRDITMLKSIK